MIIIAMLITKYGTAHTTDSRCICGNQIIGDDHRTKIVPDPRLRGAMSFYGMAEYGDFNTIDWLGNQVSLSRHSFPEVSLI